MRLKISFAVFLMCCSCWAAAQNAATFLWHSFPQTMSAGQTYTAWVAFKNTGGTTWQPFQGYKLGSYPFDNWTWGRNRVDLDTTVSPGQEKTFVFTVTAPQTPGTYSFQWHMVQEGVQWFGGPSAGDYVSVGGGTDNWSSFISQSVPWVMTTGQTLPVSLTFKNWGGTTWTSNANYRLGSQNPQDNVLWAGANRIPLSSAESILPSQTKTFNFNVTAPSTPGNYDFQWQMVQDGIPPILRTVRLGALG